MINRLRFQSLKFSSLLLKSRNKFQPKRVSLRTNHLAAGTGRINLALGRLGTVRNFVSRRAEHPISLQDRSDVGQSRCKVTG
jgi:hypothetical protein